jgi:outer membrane receptor protein involved in Fe transport
MQSRKAFNITAGVMAVLVSTASLAQTSAGDIEEVVVMATKREQTLQEVPIAVSVVDSEVLDQAQINDLVDLQASVPSLRVPQLQTTGTA